MRGIRWPRLVMLSVALVVCRQTLVQARDAADDVRAAEAAYGAGDWQAAYHGYRQLSEASPSSAIAAFRLGKCAARLGLTARATDAFMRTVKLAPADPIAYGELADSLRREKRIDAAEAAYLTAIDLAGDDAHPAWRVGLGLVELARGDLHAAERRFSAARDQDPAASAVHYNLGDVLLRQNRIDEARASYLAALHHDSSFAKAHYGLGKVSERAGATDAAITAYTAASRLDPDDPKYYAGLARVLRRSGQDDRSQTARDDYRSAVARKYLATGRAYLEAGDWRDALVRLRVAYDADPGLPGLAVAKATAHLRLGEFAIAEALLVSTAMDRSDERRAARLLAEARLAQGNSRGAVSALDAALAREPAWGPGLWLRGVALGRLGDMRRAEKDMRAAIEASPDAVAPTAWLARLLAEENRDIPAALELAVAALTAEPTPAHRATLAFVYLRMGHGSQAKLQIERARQEAPADPAVLAMHARIHGR